MKLIYLGFKIAPELRNRAKLLAVKSGTNFSEWLCNAVLSQVEKEEKESESHGEKEKE